MNTYTTKNFFIVITVVLLAGCSSLSSSTTDNPDNKVLLTPSAARIKTTATIIPTATIGYQQTAIIAQATADEARRVNVEATVEYQKVVQAQIQTTANAEKVKQQIVEWTVTAAQTSIPLTATAQSMNGTAIAKQQALISGQMTQTKEAPGQMDAMTRAQNNWQYRYVYMFVQLFTIFSIGIFLLSISAFSIWQTKRIMPSVKEETQLRPLPKIMTNGEIFSNETVIRVENTDPVYPSMDRFVVPCSPDKFTKLVVGVLQDRKTLSYENWERRNATNERALFVRGEFTKVRNFLQSNHWAQGSSEKGTLELSPEGETIFIEWLNNQALPEAYKFDEVAA